MARQSVQHTAICAAVDELQPGQALRVVSDHDPAPLRHMVDAHCAAKAHFEVEVDGSDQWVLVLRRRELPITEPD